MRMVKTKQKEPKLSDMVEKFLLVKKAQHLSELTIRDYQKELGHFLQVSDTLDYKQLEIDVLNYLSSIPDTSPARYNHPYQALNCLFNWMFEQDIIPKNPIKANKLKKKKDDGNIKPVTIDDLKTFMAAIDTDYYVGARDYAAIMVLLDTGMRTKELLSLTISDYDKKGKKLTISKQTAKTREQRFAYLSMQTVRILDNFLSIKPKEWEEWLFPNYEGRQLTVTYFDRAFAKYSALSGVKITPYQLRHSFATLFLEAGGDLFSLQKLMGHADLRMTKRYTEVKESFVSAQHQAYSPVNMLNKTPRLKKVK